MGVEEIQPETDLRSWRLAGYTTRALSSSDCSLPIYAFGVTSTMSVTVQVLPKASSNPKMFFTWSGTIYSQELSPFEITS